MSEAQPSPPSEGIDVRQLARAIRFALVALVLCLSYFGLRGSLSIGGFGVVYNDLLAGKPLPAITRFVLEAHSLFVALGFLVPAAAVATLFSRRYSASFYLIGVLGFVMLLEIVILYQGLSAPFLEIIRGMTGAM